MKPLLQVTAAEDQKREMEEELKRLTDQIDKFKFEYADLTKKNEQVRLCAFLVCALRALANGHWYLHV